MSSRKLEADHVKAMVPISEFYRTELPGMSPSKRADGWTDGGLCPFHSDTREGSFRVNVQTGAFTCYSCGAKGGDIVTFTQRRHAVCFRDALAMIAETWGSYL